ncbi:MAG TPA: hypothetical protein VNL74_05305 [Methylococcus sp.]|nr:hypothetical protein [Methylococcus sp.]
MIHIERYPRLGSHGWRARVEVGLECTEILKIGTRFDVQRAAESEESRLHRKSPRPESVEQAREKQNAVRRQAWRKA